jgi:hypothetical protein
MERLRNLIKEILSTPPKEKEGCDCGCGGCSGTPSKGITLNESLAPKQILSENLRYHLDNKLPITENTFRYGSEAFLNLWAEARSLYLREIIDVNNDDKEILEETDLGNYGMYEGIKVPLDLPLIEENISLSVRANEIPLMKILDRAQEKGHDKYPFYNELVAELGQEYIDMDEIKDILRDYGVYFEYEDLLSLNEAKEKKKNPPIGKPKRGGSKKFYVYVRKPGGGIKKVSFGDTTGLSAKINNPEARRAFAARHDCKNKKDKTKASYWSCRLPRYAKLLGLKSSFSGFW